MQELCTGQGNKEIVKSSFVEPLEGNVFKIVCLGMFVYSFCLCIPFVICNSFVVCVICPSHEMFKTDEVCPCLMAAF